MPQVVTHFLISAILVALFRDYLISKKSRKKFPLHYVFIAGLGGILPDLDIVVFGVLQFFGFTIDEVHRMFTHSLLFILILLVLSLVFVHRRFTNLGKHELSLSKIFLILAFGSLIHIILDSTIAGQVAFFYPLSFVKFGFDWVQYFSESFRDIFLPSLDAALLILWMIYLELRHKISDFI
jgi:membrane-bound metal-dependent hydrolase YbcI (DUF457 family)